MTKIYLVSRSATFSKKALWKRISCVEDYPKHVPYVHKVTYHDIRKHGYYEDVTTVLWLPMRIHHDISHYKKGSLIVYTMKLPGGGDMEMWYEIKTRKGKVELHAKITFDLGIELFNHTVGRILEKRLIRMLINVVPEMPGHIRIRED